MLLCVQETDSLSIQASQMVRVLRIVPKPMQGSDEPCPVDPRRTKRVVKYAPGTDMLDYVAGHRRLAGESPCTRLVSHPSRAPQYNGHPG